MLLRSISILALFFALLAAGANLDSTSNAKNFVPRPRNVGSSTHEGAIERHGRESLSLRKADDPASRVGKFKEIWSRLNQAKGNAKLLKGLIEEMTEVVLCYSKKTMISWPEQYRMIKESGCPVLEFHDAPASRALIDQLLNLAISAQEPTHMILWDEFSSNASLEKVATIFAAKLSTPAYIHMPFLNASPSRTPWFQLHMKLAAPENGSITMDWIAYSLIPFITLSRVIPNEVALPILLQATDLFRAEANLLDIHTSNSNQKVTVVGAIHGQCRDLLRILGENGLPDADNIYILNGNLINYGSYSIECLVLVAALKLASPESVFYLRGGHETPIMALDYGFYRELKYKYGQECGNQLFMGGCELLMVLPFAATVNDHFFVVHGGIPRSGLPDLDQIRNLESRWVETNEPGLVNTLVWATFADSSAASLNDSASDLVFGPESVEAFLATTGLGQIIRSGTTISSGVRFECNERVVTVFSATNYKLRAYGLGGYLTIPHGCEFVSGHLPCAMSTVHRFEDENHGNVRQNGSYPPSRLRAMEHKCLFRAFYLDCDRKGRGIVPSDYIIKEFDFDALQKMQV